MKNSKLDYADERDAELLRFFCEFLVAGHGTDDAVRLAISQPCSRFWTSPENAMKRISAMRRGKEYTKKGTREGRLSMFACIMERCNGDFSQKNIEAIVFSPAPKFFLSFETAKKYIYNAIKKRRCKNKLKK